MPEKTTWTQLASDLGVAQNTLRAWRTQEGSPKTKSVEAWKAWIAETKGEGKGSGRIHLDGETYTAEDIRNMKGDLVKAQSRKESAIADLRELEYRMKAESLVPESQVIEQLSKLLVPLRRLLDALPRAASVQANPDNPGIAELALRNILDERVFGEIQKIYEQYELEEIKK